ncbi:MAG: hypothetical protein Q7S70_02830 [bacterium]|nr:hypothetical protein [bacterium]
MFKGLNKKYPLIGLAAGMALLVFYFLILSLVSGWSFTGVQFRENWYWILGLSSGFGIQIGIFTFLRDQKARLSGKAVAASGSASTLAMISCCSHYLVNVLPIIGISGLAAIVGQYQTEIFVFGIVSNLAGVGYLVIKLMKFKKEKHEKI